MIEVIIASDYRGVDLKNELLEDCKLTKDISLVDIGIESGSKLDYVDISKTLSDTMLSKPDNFSVILCGSGQGVAIALNRFSHIRAATCNSVADAINAREKLNANVLCMGSKHVNIDLAANIILAFTGTDFLPDKHNECVRKLSSNQTMHHKNSINLIVRAIIEYKDHILLTTATEDNKNFAQGLFFLPGGHVEHNEPTLLALKREIYEEMGLEFKDEQFVGALECSWDRKGSIYHEIDVIYKIQIDNLNLKFPPAALDHKFHQFVWKRIDELQELVILPHSLKEIIVNRDKKNKLFLSEMLKNKIGV